MMKHSIQKAFTIVELIVAVSVTVLMLLLINQLFNDTSRAVSSGVGLSDIIGAERAMVNQISRDAARMLGPRTADPSGAGGGFLVITNETISGVTYLERNGKESTRDVRADCVAWITLRGSDDVKKYQPIAAATSNSYDPLAPEKLNGNTSYVRVFYGHGIQTLGDGSPGAATVKDNGPANHWPLLRHALFFVPRDTTPDPGGDPYWPHDTTAPVNGASVISATGPFHNSPVQNTSVGGAMLRDSYTDLVDMKYYSESPIPANGALLGNVEGSGALIDAQTATPGVLTPSATYNAAAINIMFRGANRMRVNVRPTLDKTDPYTPELISQMHPLLAVNVSDFIVEFAADADFDGNIDVDGSNNIEWYSISNPPTWVNTPAGFMNPSAGVTDAYVFRHNYKESWPYMIRMRYRLHDPRSSIQSEDPGTGEPGGGTHNGKWFEHIIRVERGI